MLPMRQDAASSEKTTMFIKFDLVLNISVIVSQNYIVRADSPSISEEVSWKGKHYLVLLNKRIE